MANETKRPRISTEELVAMLQEIPPKYWEEQRALARQIEPAVRASIQSARMQREALPQAETSPDEDEEGPPPDCESKAAADKPPKE